ncbi:hypothetical protein JOM56_010827 [Amanita muscaria]
MIDFIALVIDSDKRIKMLARVQTSKKKITVILSLLLQRWRASGADMVCRPSTTSTFSTFLPEVVIRVTPVDLVGVNGNPQRLVDANPWVLRNSEARTHEDLDRLHKAQVMYTFAEFNILEFDPALGMGCQCMAVQERKRREEHREANREGRRGTTAAAAKREWERHDDKAQCKGKQTPRANQVLFLVLHFRQRQGHLVASSLSGGERGETTAVANPTPRKQTGGFDLFLAQSRVTIFHHQQSPTPWHTTRSTYITPFLPKANMSASASKSLSKSTIVDFHTKERSQEWIPNEREHLLHRDYNLSTTSLASLKKFAMHREGRLETEAILAFQSIRFFPHRTIVETEMRRAEKPEAELILSQPQRKPPTVAMETPSETLFQRSSDWWRCHPDSI